MKSFKCVQSMSDNIEAYNKQEMPKGESNFITTGRSVVLRSKKVYSDLLQLGFCTFYTEITWFLDTYI